MKKGLDNSSPFLFAFVDKPYGYYKAVYPQKFLDKPFHNFPSANYVYDDFQNRKHHHQRDAEFCGF